MLGGEKGSVAFHGDHRPASIYVDGQVIYEPAESTQEGTMLTFDRTYNHVAEVSVFGESTQETLTGKNLLDFDKFLVDSGAVYTKEGDTYNITNRGAICQTPYRFSDTDVEVTVSCGGITAADEVSNPRFTLLKSNGTVATDIYDSSIGAGVYTDKPKTVKAAMIRGDYSVWRDGGLVSVVAPQIELGSEATSYEPYCGGIPAPNPSYPMPIVSRASACVETSNADGSKTSTTDLTALLDGRELRSLPDGTRDEVQVRDNGDGTGDVVLVERVISYTADGTENVVWFETKKECSFIMANATYGKGETSILCDMLRPVGSTVDKTGCCSGNGAIYFMVKDEITSRETSVQWLADNKPTFCFISRTPTETVLGTIQMPETFYGTTHIWEANGADISAKVKVIP